MATCEEISNFLKISNCICRYCSICRAGWPVNQMLYGKKIGCKQLYEYYVSNNVVCIPHRRTPQICLHTCRTICKQFQVGPNAIGKKVRYIPDSQKLPRNCHLNQIMKIGNRHRFICHRETNDVESMGRKKIALHSFWP